MVYPFLFHLVDVYKGEKFSPHAKAKNIFSRRVPIERSGNPPKHVTKFPPKIRREKIEAKKASKAYTVNLTAPFTSDGVY